MPLSSTPHSGRIGRFSISTASASRTTRSASSRSCGVRTSAAVRYLEQPQEGDARVVLIRQFRGRRLHLGGPAGRLDAGESPRACAGRELEEETGMRARRLGPARHHPAATPGFTDRPSLYGAGAGAGRTGRLKREIHGAAHAPLVRGVVEHGQCVDGKTLVSLLFVNVLSRSFSCDGFPRCPRYSSHTALALPARGRDLGPVRRG